jgi:IclR family acetate operon transcriptional repressor
VRRSVTDKSSSGSSEESGNVPRLLQRAADILGLITPGNAALTMTDVAAHTGLSEATAYRLLRALSALDLLSYEPATKRYGVGGEAIRLANVAMVGTGLDVLQSLAWPVLLQIRDMTGESASLHRLIDGYRYCLIEAQSEQAVRMVSGPGHRFPPTRGAASKVLLAWDDELTSAQVDDMLAAEASPVSAQGFRAELGQTRRRGWATSFSETVPGGSALALPVFGTGERLIGAVNVAGPVERWSASAIEAAREEIGSRVAGLSCQLGGLAPSSAHLDRRGNALSPNSGLGFAAGTRQKS